MISKSQFKYRLVSSRASPSLSLENFWASNCSKICTAVSYTTEYPRLETVFAMQADRKVFPRPGPPLRNRF